MNRLERKTWELVRRNPSGGGMAFLEFSTSAGNVVTAFFGLVLILVAGFWAGQDLTRLAYCAMWALFLWQFVELFRVFGCISAVRRDYVVDTDGLGSSGMAVIVTPMIVGVLVIGFFMIESTAVLLTCACVVVAHYALAESGKDSAWRWLAAVEEKESRPFAWFR